MKTKKRLPIGSQVGFTMIELIIAMLVAAILLIAVVTNYTVQMETYTVQRERARMQQELRAALFLIKNDLRNSGRNGDMTAEVGIRDPQMVVVGANSYPSLRLTTFIDTNGDGVADDNSIQTVTYQLLDMDPVGAPDGILELRRQVIPPGGPAACPGGVCVWDLIAEGIEDVSYSFAIDADNNNDLDRSAAPNSNLVWAIDSDNNGRLDCNADTNNDGDITQADDTNADGVINTVDGAIAGGPFAISAARAVRIQILARSRQQYNKFQDTTRYALAHRVINPVANNTTRFRRMLVDGSIALLNHERVP